MLDAYKDREVLNIGFTTRAVTMEEVTEHGSNMPWAPTPKAPALIGFVQVMGLKAGDTQHLVLVDPQGQAIARSTIKPLAKDQAQSLMFAGKRRSRQAWGAGSYTIDYTVRRGGVTLLHERHRVKL
jgi:hypothetical protein